MSDLNKRLRWHAERQSIIPSPKLMVEAANEIERLREALDTVKAAVDGVVEAALKEGEG